LDLGVLFLKGRKRRKRKGKESKGRVSKKEEKVGKGVIVLSLLLSVFSMAYRLID